MRAQRRWQRILALGIAAGALSACATVGDPPVPTQLPTIVRPTATPAPRAATYTVQRGEVVAEITLEGRVAPVVDEDLFFTQSGVLAELAVSAGDVITQGQALARLDAQALEEGLAEAQRELSFARRRLDEQHVRQQAAIRGAQLNLEDAQARLAQLVAGPKPAEIEAARAAAAEARLSLESARRTTSLAKTEAEAAVTQAANDLRERQEDYALLISGQGAGDGGAEAQVERDRARRAMEEASLALELARAAYDSAVRAEIEAVTEAEGAVRLADQALAALLAPPDPQEVAQAERDVKRAELALETAQRGEGVAATEAIDRARSEVERIQAQIEQTRISAPFSGIVAETYLSVGEPVEEFAPVITVLDPAQIDLLISNVPADALAKIAPAHRAELSFSNGRAAVGEVSKVPGPNDTGAAASTIRIAFPVDGLGVQVGDIASAQLLLARSADALWLPPAAVRSFDLQRFVVVADGAAERQVDVRVGIVTAERVEILSGLREGDVVLGPTVE